MNIALLGFGTVGYGVYDMASHTENLTVKYVLDLKKHEDISAHSVTDITEILEDPSVDTVVELIGGENPAYTFIKKSLLAGKNVITANKLVICKHYEELTALSKQQKVALRYTAAVGGGIPWLVNLERTLRISNVHRVRGIFNGTTNYILDAMHKCGTTFEAALKEAQQLGFAEADPSSDIDGLDTQRKIAISANVAFGVLVNPDEIDVFGIRTVSAEAVRDCEEHGFVCKLMAKARNKNGMISVWVEPTFVKKTSSFAAVSQNYNRISYDADNVGRGSFSGFGAGRYPTAYTVVGDCVDVANGVKRAYNSNMRAVTVDNSIVAHRYYVKTTASGDWLESNTEQQWRHGVLLKPQSVKQMHAMAAEIKKTDPNVFIAGVY